jgi:hypothetical protein
LILRKTPKQAYDTRIIAFNEAEFKARFPSRLQAHAFYSLLITVQMAPSILSDWISSFLHMSVAKMNLFYTDARS